MSIVAANLVPTPPSVAEQTQLPHDAYRDMQRTAAQDPDAFWAMQARQILTWDKDFTITRTGDFSGDAHVRYFEDGMLNVSVNCLDRHLQTRGEQTALIWVGDALDEEKTFTYRQCHEHVCRWANLLQQRGVKKGDRVVIYLPMIPEAAFAMLACARIGAIHVVVFAGFSAQALRDRIVDTGGTHVITANIGFRGGKKLLLKETVDQAVAGLSHVREVLVVARDATPVSMTPERDVAVESLLAQMPNTHDAVSLHAEDPLFILYTSGSTGKPKGLVHTQAGYLLYAALTHRVVFDIRAGDVYFCTADVGWITGHSYIVYGPLANGTTTVMFEGVPTYPDETRYWQIIDRYKVTQFYTAPTALRSLMRFGDAPLQTTQRSSLRILGSVGEPINPEVWRWYFDVVGKGHCAVVDTWWQTETGGHLITPVPSMPEMIAGAAMQPFFGIVPLLQESGALFITKPWPSIARTVWGDHNRFLQSYFTQSAGLYCTGDGATCDEKGFYTITGRIDDVINVSGHRFGTAEIESALVDHAAVAEAAVIGRDHAMKGTGIYAFVTLKEGVVATDALKQELNAHVRQQIGAIASLDWLQWAPALPKTRSGKIMRRILRKIASGDVHELGDTSTLADPAVVDALIAQRVD